MKHLLLGLTSTEEIKKVLKNCVDNNLDTHKDLAEKLATKFPLSGWTERCLNYMLLQYPEGSQSIDMVKANQLMEFLYPEEKFQFSTDNFYNTIEEMQERLAGLRAEFTRAMKTEKTVDDKELKILLANANILTHLISKFEEMCLKVVNVRMS